MASPFGGHPTLGRFVEWAVENGCVADIKVRTHTVHGRPYEVLELVAPSGGRVAVANPDVNEHLSPSQVAYMQRRIGLRSPFPATPEQPKQSDVSYVDVSDKDEP